MAKTPELVQMAHPKVKRDAHVAESAVPVLEQSGWKRADAKPAADKPADTRPAAKAPVKNEKEDG